MKVVQRDHKLTKYTLENVAGTFIRGEINGYQYIYEDDDKYAERKKERENSFQNQNPSKIKKEKKKEDMDCYSSDEEDDDKSIDDDVHIRRKQDNDGKKRIKQTILKVKSVRNIKVGDYVAIYYNDGPTDNVIGEKKKVLELNGTKGCESILVEGKVRVRPYLKRKWDVFWCQGKDDMEAKDIFRMYKGTSNERGIVAKYCMKDCSLCNRLMAMLQILPNNIGMGNVCTVPLSFLFTRGQSIKIFSLVAKECRDENYLIPDNKRKMIKKMVQDGTGKMVDNPEYKTEKTFQRFIRELINEDDDDEDDEDDDGYEGATVFDPTKGVHYDPIIVGDYSSLYPSSMIMKNLSHNSIVLDSKYDNLPGYKYHEQSYNKPDGTKATYRFAERADGTKATIPRILQKLLSARKKYNNLKGEEKDPFKKAVWDGLQLAYKVTANSLYGQCGSSISPIAMKPIAACTTSVGRDMLELARDFVENNLKTIVYLIKDAIFTGDDTKYLAYMRDYYKNVPDKRVGATEIVKNEKGEKIMENGKPLTRPLYTGKEEYYQWIKIKIYELVGDYDICPECIYGDTDSVFFKLNLKYKETGVVFNSHDALKISIDMGIIGTGILNHTLAFPQALAYEKVYWPFIILSKKRYVGNLYSDDPNDFYQKSMGLVTKRRDNADIVKVVVGGIIDQILNHRSPEGAVKFTQSRLMRIITGKYGIDKFIITKTLRDKETYKNWMNMAHVVLADRMAQRDAGNKPQSNDRIPFVFIEVQKEVKLQGERVEHPSYIQENNLKIDFMYYIEYQIMKPALQFLEQIVKNPDAIFKKFIIREENRKGGTEPIMKCLGDVPTDQGKGISVNFGDLSSQGLFSGYLPSGNQKRKVVRKKLPKIFDS
jgi:DNA polymerase elongation subunit (family B)